MVEAIVELLKSAIGSIPITVVDDRITVGNFDGRIVEDVLVLWPSHWRQQCVNIVSPWGLRGTAAKLVKQSRVVPLANPRFAEVVTGIITYVEI